MIMDFTYNLVDHLRYIKAWRLSMIFPGKSVWKSVQDSVIDKGGKDFI